MRADEERMQSQNLRSAFSKLAAKLIPILKAHHMTVKDTTLPTERIRTYNQKENRVTDERLPGKVFSYCKTLNGDELEKIIQELKKS